MQARRALHFTIHNKEVFMKFRSPTEHPVHLALTSGHTAVVGPDPVELDARWHRVAIERGCVPAGGRAALPTELRLLAADQDDAAAAERDRAERAAQVRARVEQAEREHREGTGKDLPQARREQIRREAAQQLERAATA
jgi:hypothetical protein